ncbi:MAG: hypothetical protein ACOY4I_02440 [Bacillota bacterium]
MLQWGVEDVYTVRRGAAPFVITVLNKRKMAILVSGLPNNVNEV